MAKRREMTFNNENDKQEKKDCSATNFFGISINRHKFVCLFLFVYVGEFVLVALATPSPGQSHRTKPTFRD
jgi:hypothetical protein